MDLRRDKAAAEADLRRKIESLRVLRISEEQDDAMLAPIRNRIERLARDIARKKEGRDARAARWSQMRGLVDNLDQYLRENAVTARAIKSKITKPSGDPRRAIDTARRRIEELRTQRRQVEAAPIPAAEAKRRGPLRRSTNWPSVAALTCTGPRVMGPDALALFTFIHREAVLTAISQEIDETTDQDAALSDGDRAQRLAEVDAALLSAERVEEAAIEAAEAVGMTIDRRRDADPRAVLCLADDMPKPRPE